LHLFFLEMIKNHIKVALRNTIRHKGYSFINIAGLAIGMACCIVLFLYIQNELSFDRFHKNSDRIYRVISQNEGDGKVSQFAKTPAPLAPALVNDFPEIERTVRLGKNGFFVTFQNKRFNETIIFADPEIFSVFSFPLTAGDPKTALTDPHSLVISEKAAEKYFGKEDPLGKVLRLESWQDFKITGILKNIPENSHLKFDFLGRFEDYAARDFDQWGISNYYTYVLVSNTFSQKAYKEKLPAFIEKYVGSDARYVYKRRFPLQAMTRIHLHSSLRGEISPNNDIRNITIFSIIALFILLIACFNYMNLSTARYTIRTKEVGLRKVIGATKIQLVRQFMGETFVLTFISLFLTLGLAELFLPLFKHLSGKDLMLDWFHNPILILFVAVILLFVSIVSGIYPSFFISGFQPSRALKGQVRTKSHVPLLRQALVISQFAVSITFIITTTLIISQLNYMKNKKLGFEKEHIVVIPLQDSEVLKNVENMKRELSSNPSVLSVCASSYFPGRRLWYQNYWYEGAPDNTYPMMHWIAVDYDFIDTFQIEILEGRNFSREFHGDSRNSYLLNETAVREIGWESPIGKQFGIIERGPVIGVVKDFHFFSLHQKIEPLALLIYPEGLDYLVVRISPDAVPDTLAFLGRTWNEFSGTQPFEYSFLDEDYDNLYKAETRLTKIFGYVTLLSIFIACLGLFGLASFMIERKTKEIGIRKVLGASVSNLFLTLSREFVKCVLVANIIAWPLGYFIMSQWLQNFAYRISIGVWVFLAAMGAALFIALLTVSYQTIRAAVADPVNVLRYE
jgi:putative ABC transport system permease protein